MRDLYALSAAELAALPRDRTVFFFALGGLSDHGPHLPIGLDWIEAQALVSEFGQRVEALGQGRDGWTAIRMPALNLSVRSTRKGLTLHTRAPVVRDALIDQCDGLIRLGFRFFFVTSGDLEPRQLCAIEDAGRKLGRRNWRLGRGRRIAFGSLCSALTVPSDAWRSVLGRRRSDKGGSRDLAIARALTPALVGPAAPAPSVSQSAGELLLRDQVSILWPKLQACLVADARPRLIFQSWYSVIPWYRSTFTAWVLVFGILLLWAMMRMMG